jgi:hypothetical protein
MVVPQQDMRNAAPPEHHVPQYADSLQASNGDKVAQLPGRPPHLVSCPAVPPVNDEVPLPGLEGMGGGPEQQPALCDDSSSSSSSRSTQESQPSNEMRATCYALATISVSKKTAA